MSARRSGGSRNLATTLTLAFIAMSVAAFAISGGGGIFFLIQTQKEAVAGKQQAVAYQVADAVAGFIREKFSVMETAVRLTGSDLARKNVLQALLDLEPAFRQLLLLNTSHQQLLRVSRNPGAGSKRLDDQLGSDLFSSVSAGERHISPVYEDPVTGEPLVILSIPGATLLGDRLGILLAEVNLKFIWDLVGRLRVGQGGHAYVLDRRGRLIAFGDTGRVLRGEALDHLSDVSDFINRNQDKDHVDVNTFIGITGEKVVGAYVPLGDPDWAVIADLPVKEIYRQVIGNSLISIFIFLIMSVLAGLLGIILARRLATPIVDLTQTADRIADGELDVRADVGGPTEVIRLSAAFNKMTRQLGRMLDKELQRTQRLKREISQRKEAQRALEESESILRATLEATEDGVLVVDRTGYISHYNKRFAQIWSIPDDRLAARNDRSLIDYVLPQVNDPGQFTRRINRLYQSNRPSEDILNLNDGRILERFSYPLIEKEREKGRVWFFRDITDRKQAEEALRENEQLLSNILESMNEGVLVLDKKFQCTIFNSSLRKMRDKTNVEVIGKTPWESNPDLKDTPLEKNIRKAMAGQSTGSVEINLPTPGGGSEWFSDSFSPLKDTNGKIIGVVGVVSDITQRKQNEEELRWLRNYFSNIIDSMPSILVAVDHDGKVTQWNSQTAQATGLSFDRVRSQPLAEVFPRLADEMNRIRTAIRERRVISSTKVPRKAEADVRYEDITIFPLVTNGVEGAVIRVDDVTQQVRLEEIMIQSEKMLSVGGLAAGMAHEINNPLAGILQSASVLENRLLGDLPANQKAAEAAGISLAAMRQYMMLRRLPDLIGNIHESGSRAAAIVRNMLSFARKSEKMVSSKDLGMLLDQTIELLQTDYDMKTHHDFKRIRIERAYDPVAPPVPCESGKVQQVFMNILKNGAEAMSEVIDVSDPPAFILRVKNDGIWVRVEIKDNGPGMDERTRRRIFEPFFTTKPAGKGTGLGLSVSYFIIAENHGGEMSVHTADGGGSCFVIRLPKAGRKSVIGDR